MRSGAGGWAGKADSHPIVALYSVVCHEAVIALPRDSQKKLNVIAGNCMNRGTVQDDDAVNLVFHFEQREHFLHTPDLEEVPSKMLLQRINSKGGQECLRCLSLVGLRRLK